MSCLVATNYIKAGDSTKRDFKNGKIELKEKLLNTGCFEDNEWLDKYVELIISENIASHIKYKSAEHHIIPKHYYIHNNLEVDNSETNLVELLHVNHAKAHLYLSLSSTDNYYKSANAMSMWLILGKKNKYRVINNNEANSFLDLIEDLSKLNIINYSKSEECIQKHKLLRWYNNGVEEFQWNPEVVVIPDGFMPGRLKEQFKGINSNTVWINNGEVNLHPTLDEALNILSTDSSFTYGMLDRGEEWHNNIISAMNNLSDEALKNKHEGTLKFHQQHPHFTNSGSFKKGQDAHNKGKKWVTNGNENHYINIEDLSKWETSGWRLGTTQKRNKKVKAIYTDGSYKWISIKSVDKYIKDGYIIDYNAVGNTRKSKHVINK